MPTNLSYPLLGKQLIDERGYLARPWQQFFEALVVRVGQDRAMTNLELEEDTVTNAASAATNAAAIEAETVLSSFTPLPQRVPEGAIEALFVPLPGQRATDIEQLFADRGLAAMMAGSTRGTHSLWIPAQAMVPATTLGGMSGHLEMATNKNNYMTLTFSNSGAKEYAGFQVAFPKKWNEGTLTYAVYWTLNSTSTNSVVFGLQAVAISNDDPLDVAYGAAQEVTDAGLGTAYDNHVSPTSSALTIAGTPADADMVDFRFYRDSGNGSDTLAVSVEVLGVKLFYTTDASTDA